MSSTPRRKRVLSVSTATRTPPRLSGEHDAAPAALEDVFMPAVSSSPQARRTVFDDGCSRSSKIESAASSFAFPAGSAIVSPRRSRANTINRQHQPAAARQSRYFGSALGHDQPGAERQAVRSAYVVRSVRPPLPSLGRNHAATRAPRSSLDQASASPLKRQWRDVAATIFLVSAALLLTLWHVLRGRAVETLSEVAAVEQDTMQYAHIDFDAPTQLPANGAPARVVHVTREFGGAAVSDAGKATTRLVRAQHLLSKGRVVPAVVMPLWTCLLDEAHASAPEVYAQVDVALHDASKGRQQRLSSTVYRLGWRDAAFADTSADLPLYLIAPPVDSAYARAFDVRSCASIPHTSDTGADLFFAKAAAEVTERLATDPELDVARDSLFEFERADDLSGGSATTADASLDVVHIHGAAVAMTALSLDDLRRNGDFGPTPPALVYHMPNMQAEASCRLSPSQAVPLVSQLHRASSQLASALSGCTDQPDETAEGCVPAEVALLLSDHATVGSVPLAAAVLEGSVPLDARDLLTTILDKASELGYNGLSVALDATERARPFSSSMLQNVGAAFPKVDGGVLDYSTFWHRDESDALAAADENPLMPVLFAERKQVAKRAIIQSKTLSPDLERMPWMLAPSNADECEVAGSVIETLASGEAHAVVVAPNERCLRMLRRYSKRRSQRLTLFQAPTNELVRMAADFAILPRLAPSTDREAALALLFGTSVLVSKSTARHGSLFSHSSDQGAYLCQSPPTGALDCASATRRAVVDWLARSAPERWLSREKHVRRLLADALSLAWERERGPLDELTQIYGLAIAHRRSGGGALLRRNSEEQQNGRLGLLYELESVDQLEPVVADEQADDEVADELAANIVHEPAEPLPVFKVFHNERPPSKKDLKKRKKKSV